MSALYLAQGGFHANTNASFANKLHGCWVLNHPFPPGKDRREMANKLYYDIVRGI